MCADAKGGPESLSSGSRPGKIKAKLSTSGWKRESCINNSLEHNAILSMRGIDTLTPTELKNFLPFWDDFVDNIGTMTADEFGKQLAWAERLSTDEEFAMVWIATVRQLFDVEDVNGDKTLQKDEFFKFMTTIKLIMLNPDRAAAQNSPEKIERAWNALKDFTEGEDVNWNDFMKMQQVIQCWCEGGLLMHELDKRGYLDNFIHED